MDYVLKNIIKEISKLSYVSCIFLFGSQVTGKERRDSDIDIAVSRTVKKRIKLDKENAICSNTHSDTNIHNSNYKRFFI